MQLDEVRKSIHVIRPIVIAILIFLLWFYSLSAYGMGLNRKIDGLLIGTEEEFGVTDGIRYGLPRGRCVLLGVSMTGLGVEAISYQGQHLGCHLFHRVDDVLNEAGWCSQWVVPNAPSPCTAHLQPKIQTSYTGFLGCPPGCQYSPYQMGWSGNSHATSYEVQRNSYGNWYNHYTGTQTSTTGTSNGTTSPGVYRLRAVNEYGESDWVYFTLHVQCSSTQNPW